MKNRAMLAGTLAAGLLAFGTASASATYSGDTSLDADGIWDNPLTVACAACAFDVQEFTVDADGLYTIDAFYPGDAANDENLDGYLILYEGSFDPLDGSTGIIADDDDGPGGPTTSQIADVSLTAGTSYFLVTTAFSDAPTTFGQPAGVFENTIAGDGNVTLVGAPIPAPAALWLLGSALIGLGAARRKA
ncbi:MAG: VPLPA-CTERM sorting domain-containing protein [Pseudomonadota bacterium]